MLLAALGIHFASLLLAQENCTFLVLLWDNTSNHIYSVHPQRVQFPIFPLLSTDTDALAIFPLNDTDIGAFIPSTDNADAGTFFLTLMLGHFSFHRC